MTPGLLDAVTFDTAGYVRQQDQEDTLIWLTPDGDTVSLSHIPLAPGQESGLNDVTHMRAQYRDLARELGGAIVEADVHVVGGYDIGTGSSRCRKNRRA